MPKKVFIPLLSVLLAAIVLLSPIAPVQNLTIPNPELGIGQALDPSGNPFAHTFSDVKDIRTATFVAAASDSVHEYDVDYRCDGTNDHVEIQTALDALPDTGGEVFLLDGTYYIEASLVLDSYQTLRGCGRNTILTTTTADLDIITVAHKVGILIADLCVDGAAGGAANDEGILWNNVDYSQIRNIWLQNNGNYGMYVANGSDFNTIMGNICQGNFTHGIRLESSHNNTITGNVYQGSTGGDGIYLDAACNNTVTGNACSGNIYGIRLDSMSNANTITDNVCQGNWYGIYLGGSDSNAIIGNVCLENSQGTDNTHDNIYLSTSDYNLIACNVCRRGDLAKQPKYGINISNNTCDKNIVQGNDLHNAGKTANFNDAGTCTIVQDDNQEINQTQVKHMVYMKNTSGGNLVVGDVVSLNAIAAGTEFTTPAGVGEDQVWGMLAENINDDAWGYVQVKGGTTLLKATNAVGGNIAIGDFLCTEAAGTRAQKAAAGNMAFAIALEVCEAADVTIDALIIVPRKI